jgi:hypothetical protein
MLRLALIVETCAAMDETERAHALGYLIQRFGKFTKPDAPRDLGDDTPTPNRLQ